MEIKKNDDIKLHIDAMTSEGSAIGRYGSAAVFVRGAVPGDELIAHIIKVSKRYCIGVIKEIISPSPSRIEPDCPVSSKCGGCSFRNMTYDEELKYKKQRVEDALKRIGGLDVPVSGIIAATAVDGYRNKAQYPVRIENGELKAGFYAYKSHRIIPCAECRLQPAVFGECLAAFARWIKAAQLTSYDETSRSGLLRHIYLREARTTGEIMACAVINGDVLPKEEALINELCAVKGVKSICVNINKTDSNVILGKETRIIWGSETLSDFLLGKQFEISPDSFYQVNHDQCERLYSKAAEYAALTGNETVLDLYCGTGTIGLTLADRAKSVYGIEIIPGAIENAKKNARINSLDNAHFICADAFKGAEILEARGVKPDVIILDPPRKGCSSELLDLIVRTAPKRIVYVSCDSATLARDLRILDENGYKVLEITAVDMFPRTPHVEAVARIERLGS